MAKEFNSLKEIEKYYDEKSNTYVFKENDEYINTVVFNFDLNVKADIDALDINANNINAYNINAYNINADDIYAWNIYADDIKTDDIYAWNINAYDIKANDINYYAVCYAYKNIKCNSIKGRRENSKHFVLDGKLEVENE